jgi:plasmid maintenance system antidote protein VapI
LYIITQKKDLTLLREYLKQRKIRIIKLAQSLKVTPQRFNNWLSRGVIPTKYILPLSKELNITAEELLKMITE